MMKGNDYTNISVHLVYAPFEVEMKECTNDDDVNNESYLVFNTCAFFCICVMCFFLSLSVCIVKIEEIYRNFYSKKTSIDIITFFLSVCDA